MHAKMDTGRMAKIMKALSHPNRLELFLEIARGAEGTNYVSGCACECFISELIKKMRIGAPTVSHHLKELSNAGLILTERRGKLLVARLNEEVLAEVRDLLEQLGCNRQ